MALASAQVQLKKVMEEKRNIENQRNKLGQEISALEDNVEVCVFCAYKYHIL